MKRIVIVGATSGIGLEVAKLCIQAGWQIGAAGRREEALEKLRTQAPDLIVTESLDITRDDAPEHLSRLIDKLGGMDIYLHCSGIGKRNTELHPDIDKFIFCCSVKITERNAFKVFGPWIPKTHKNCCTTTKTIIVPIELPKLVSGA